MSSISDRFDWLVRFTIVRWNFIHRILLMLKKSSNTQVGTMGVRVLNGNMELVYNPEFIKGLSDAELTYVFYHEVLHLALHHCTLRRFSNHELGNIAQDLAVNDLIPVEKGSCEPPKGICLVDEFRKNPLFKGIKNKQTAEYYYDLLSKAEGGGTSGKDGKGGKGLPDVRNIDNHEGWSEDEIADTKVRAEIDHIAKSNLWGSVPGESQAVIMAAQVKRHNWRSLVKQFYGNKATSTKEYTLRRPNRRMGYLLPGSRREKVDKHLVVIDTSGSTMEFLPKFLAVVNTMVDYLDIDIIQCDTAIIGKPEAFERCRKEFKFSGMGGTNFQPIIDLVNEKRYRSVSIVTDGQAAECTKPERADVLWILPEGCEPPVEWGRRVTIDKDR